MRAIVDERVKGQNYQIGFEAFLIVYGLLCASLFVRSIILEQKPGEYLDILAIFLIGSCYYAVKALMGGILFASPGACGRAACDRGTVVAGFVAALIFCGAMAFRIVPVCRQGSVDWGNLARTALSGLVFFAFWLIAVAAMRGLSRKRAEKDLEE